MSTPQFSTAEYQGKPSTDVCKLCGQAVGAIYYRVGGAMACGPCAEKAQREGPKDGHSAFVRALLFGAGGALLGLALYATFAIATGLIVGYVSLAVGFIVAKAMMLGSKGIGGRRYQIAAVILTYAAVSLAAIPISIAYIVKNRGANPQIQTVKQTPSESSSSADQPKQQPTAPRMNFGEAILRLVLLGLASSFLELQTGGIGSIIGLIILFVGIRIAWKIAEGKPASLVDGPFQNAASVR